MKVIITVFTLFLTLFSLAQDKELFGYINQYRVGNGLSEIKWDNKLSELSISQNKEISESDSLFHSRKNTYENLVKSDGVPHDLKLESKFKKFCKKHVVFNAFLDFHVFFFNHIIFCRFLKDIRNGIFMNFLETGVVLKFRYPHLKNIWIKKNMDKKYMDYGIKTTSGHRFF